MMTFCYTLLISILGSVKPSYWYFNFAKKFTTNSLLVERGRSKSMYKKEKLKTIVNRFGRFGANVWEWWSKQEWRLTFRNKEIAVLLFLGVVEWKTLMILQSDCLFYYALRVLTAVLLWVPCFYAVEHYYIIKVMIQF